jgi:hypothetical protein
MEDEIMQIETYECTELSEETSEDTAQAVDLIEQLDLGGQRGLVSIDKRMPYPQASREQLFVFQTLCPVEEKLHEYNRTTIPLRVLQVAAHAKDLFDELYIWDAAGVDKDPVLVGAKKNGQWSRTYYLLARWGEVLEAWPILLKRALEKKRAALADHARSMAAKWKSIAEAGVTERDEQLIQNGAAWTPSVY